VIKHDDFAKVIAGMQQSKPVNIEQMFEDYYNEHIAPLLPKPAGECCGVRMYAWDKLPPGVAILAPRNLGQSALRDCVLIISPDGERTMK
jgi:hypothetical protein